MIVFKIDVQTLLILILRSTSVKSGTHIADTAGIGPFNGPGVKG